MDDRILLDAGSGGRASQRLISQCFMRHFSNPLLDRMDDAALLDIKGPLAMSTDSYTVTPLFFAGPMPGVSICWARAPWPCTARSTTWPCWAPGPAT